MRSFLKWTFIVLFSLFAIVGILVVGCTALVVQGVKEVTNPKIEQKYLYQNKKHLIHLPMLLKKEIQLNYDADGYCEEAIVKEGFSSYNQVCHANKCQVTLGLSDPAPSYVFMRVKQKKGECKNISVAIDSLQVRISGFEVIMDLTQEIQKRTLDDYESVTVTKTAKSRYKGFKTWKMMGTRKIKLIYDQPVAQDELKVNGTLFRLNFYKKEK